MNPKRWKPYQGFPDSIELLRIITSADKNQATGECLLKDSPILTFNLLSRIRLHAFLIPPQIKILEKVTDNTVQVFLEQSVDSLFLQTFPSKFVQRMGAVTRTNMALTVFFCSRDQLYRIYTILCAVTCGKSKPRTTTTTRLAAS